MMTRSDRNPILFRLFILLISSSGVWAQSTAPVSLPLATSRGGFSIAALTTYFAFDDVRVQQAAISPSLALGGAFSSGAALQAGYKRKNQRGLFTLDYSFSFAEQRGLSTSSADHSLSAKLIRSYSPRLNSTWTVSGSISSLANSLFDGVGIDTQPLTSVVSSTSPDAFGGNKASDSPLRSALFGYRVYSASFTNTWDYSLSPRAEVRVQIDGSRTQNGLGGEAALDQRQRSLLQDVSSAGVSAGASYAASQSVSIGTEIQTTYSVSSLFSSRTTSWTANAARTLKGKWQIEAQSGVAVSVLPQKGLARQQGPAFIAGGQIGYRGANHVFLLSQNKTFGDSYGIGSGGDLSTILSWSWSRRGGAWGTNANFTYERLSAVGNQLTGLFSRVGVARRLSSQLQVLAECAFLSNSSFDQRFGTYKLDRRSARVSFVWSPRKIR